VNRRPVSDPELRALGEFQGEIERSSNTYQQALDHNLGRNVKVVKLLGYLALLKQAGVVLKEPVECIAAALQNFSSSKSMTRFGLPVGPMEAAHFLPGQVWIANREVWHFAKSPETRGHIEFLFADVEHLPATFNQADTAAENKGQNDGLCGALIHACKTLIGRRLATDAVAGKISMDLVQAAYEDWHKDATAALARALETKSAKPGIPALVGDRFSGYTMESVAAPSTAAKTQWNRDEACRVLQYYAKDQQNKTWQWVTRSCQGALQEVESNFKG
jgi:hypothetical protein